MSAYSKGDFADAIAGGNRRKLEEMARDRGFSTTEEYFRATGGTGVMPGEVVKPTLDALTEYGASMEEKLPGELAQLESEYGRYGEEVQEQRDFQLGQLQTQEDKARQRETSAIAEARRQGDELMQGIQARFGGTTGTGAFAGELLGRDVMRSVGQAREQASAVIGEINTARSNLGRQVSMLMSQSQERLAEAKERVRRDLKDRLAEINLQKGMLESQKAEIRMQNLQQANAMIAQREQQEKAYQLEIMRMAENKQSQLLNLAAQYKPDVFNDYISGISSGSLRDVSSYLPDLGKIRSSFRF